MKKLIAIFISIAAIGAFAEQSQFQPKSLFGNWRISSDEMENALEHLKKDDSEAFKGSGALALMFLAINIEISDSQFLYTMDPRLIFKALEKPVPEDMPEVKVEEMLKCDWSADKEDTPNNFTATCTSADKKTEFNCAVTYPNACQFTVVCNNTENNDKMDATFTNQYDDTVKVDASDAHGGRDDSFSMLVPIKN